MIDEKLIKEMQDARNIINLGLSLRAAKGIKVRQPLSELKIKNNKLRSELLDIVKEEVNVKSVTIDSMDEISLDTEITEDLRLEGMAREIIRFIQEMRKEADYEVDNRIKVGYDSESLAFERFGNMIGREVLATEIQSGKLNDFDLEKEFSLEGEKVRVQIKKVVVP